MTLPHKTVERLSQYRRVLLENLKTGKTRINSLELAAQLHNTPEQVRRDIMLMGYHNAFRRGYDIESLIKSISKVLDSETNQNVAIVGLGNLGRALIGYLKGKKTNLSIVAAFDTNPEKINRIIGGVNCYSNEIMAETIKKLDISIAILTVPGDVAATTAETLVLSGIKGILNYTPVRLNVPDNVYLEEYDMLTSLEKVSFFVKQNTN